MPVAYTRTGWAGTGPPPPLCRPTLWPKGSLPTGAFQTDPTLPDGVLLTLQWGGLAGWGFQLQQPNYYVVNGSFTWDAGTNAFRYSGTRGYFSSPSFGFEAFELAWSPTALCSAGLLRASVDEGVSGTDEVLSWVAEGWWLAGTGRMRSFNGGSTWASGHVRGMVRKVGGWPGRVRAAGQLIQWLF